MKLYLYSSGNKELLMRSRTYDDLIEFMKEFVERMYDKKAWSYKNWIISKPTDKRNLIRVDIGIPNTSLFIEED